jgi:hypothetical protein
MTAAGMGSRGSVAASSGMSKLVRGGGGRGVAALAVRSLPTPTQLPCACCVTQLPSESYAVEVHQVGVLVRVWWAAIACSCRWIILVIASILAEVTLACCITSDAGTIASVVHMWLAAATAVAADAGWPLCCKGPAQPC